MKIGLITYHSAYNFGSVLQAYATQETIKKIAGDCEIINYRSKEQKRFYSIFKIDKNNIIKSAIKNILTIHLYKAKKKRQEKYEKVINSIFNLSDEYIKPDDVYKIWDKYDLIVSGSDQIWNKHSNELKDVSWNYILPYVLHGYKGKKVSYASSPSNMSVDDIKHIINDLRKFNYISIREKESCEFLKKEFNLDTTNVLDPTFLLSKEEWIKKLSLEKKGQQNYILYYALGSRKETNTNLLKLKKYADLNGLKLKVIAPLSILKKIKGIEFIYDADPIDFLNLIYNANKIITDSYHGTILSINFEKDIYSICRENGAEFRKTDILKKLNMKDRIIRNIDNFFEKINENNEIDYNYTGMKLNKLKTKSLKYLEDAIGEKNGNM